MEKYTGVEIEATKDFSNLYNMYENCFSLMYYNLPSENINNNKNKKKE